MISADPQLGRCPATHDTHPHSTPQCWRHAGHDAPHAADCDTCGLRNLTWRGEQQ